MARAVAALIVAKKAHRMRSRASQDGGTRIGAGSKTIMARRQAPATASVGARIPAVMAIGLSVMGALLGHGVT